MTTRAARPTRRAGALADAGTEPVGVDLARLRNLRLAEMAIRFAFGFAISVLAGVVTILAGNHIGGVFLAFPAILPASLTLVGDKDGDDEAELDAAGATIGAVALGAFALTASALFVHVTAAITMTTALVVWVCAAAGLYNLTCRTLRRRRRRQS